MNGGTKEHWSVPAIFGNRVNREGTTQDTSSIATLSSFGKPTRNGRSDSCAEDTSDNLASSLVIKFQRRSYHCYPSRTGTQELHVGAIVIACTELVDSEVENGLATWLAHIYQAYIRTDSIMGRARTEQSTLEILIDPSIRPPE